MAPSRATLRDIGATQQFSAEARDADGNLLLDSSFSWSSSNTAVATVDGSGLATAESEGSARIIASADGVVDSAILVVDTASSGSGEVVIPAESEWTDHGVVVPLGSPGDWDALISGSFTPSTVVKVNGTIHLYYVGADGDRSDGGPANRALGVATSTDGISFTKYSGNPVVTHQPDGGHGNVEEEGVFSAGGWVEADGTVDMYYGGMESTGSSSVDGDGVLETSSDGLTFSGQQDVFRNEDSATIGNDELFPFAAFEHGGTWHVYYIAKGGVSWAVALARGPAPNDLTSHTQVLDTSNDIKGGGNVIFLSDTKILVPLGFGPNPHDYEMRSTTVDAPADLSTNAVTYQFPNLREGTFYLDRELERWFFYYITGDVDGIHLRTTPMRTKYSRPSDEAQGGLLPVPSPEQGELAGRPPGPQAAGHAGSGAGDRGCRPRLLGVEVAHGETELTWSQFLGGLTDRDLRGVGLVVSDAHLGLGEARRKHLPGVPWQRCQRHFLENALEKVPQALEEELHEALRAIWGRIPGLRRGRSGARGPDRRARSGA